uniref:Uncharacterized protein n=1 Tax=Hyaloperonospora arabidopsidis (strain Emoy2) TaxID=559515 RepID=M4B1M8_HYAAE
MCAVLLSYRLRKPVLPPESCMSVCSIQHQPPQPVSPVQHKTKAASIHSSTLCPRILISSDSSSCSSHQSRRKKKREKAFTYSTVYT